MYKKFAVLAIAVLSFVNLSATNRYMPGSYYSNNNINYIYTRVWTIDKSSPVTQLTMRKKLTGRALFYRNMQRSILRDIDR